ncbi:hypothetical protein BT93_H2254 [Corymbia citriodora subsp. variegata]|nr:hypothetical protein BT93_H2254 [Corymbia citriodora subsp. variegata]
MESTQANQLRLVALCKKMGDLWAEDEVTVLHDTSPESQPQDNDFILYGKLLSKPNVNFQAFYSTMKRSWKLDEVKCPWSFASNLLVLHEGDPHIPEHCYDFTHCSFWVHMVGLPRVAITEDSIRMIAGKLGVVEAVRIEARNNSSRKTGKARVKLNLLHPLKIGTIIQVGDKKWWIDFKYERLPHFCYSCGHMESGLPQDKAGKYGSWLKAEVKEPSPCWQTFYGDLDTTLEMEDMMSKEVTPPEGNTCRSQNQIQNSQALVLYTLPLKLNSETAMLVANGPINKGKRIQNDADFRQAKSDKSRFKNQVAKKLKRFAPYEKRDSLACLVDVDKLTDTPIQVCEGAMAGALVARPNKPPKQP